MNKVETYKNRYGDIFTFTLDEERNIHWEGNFEYCRFGMPNDYTYAYKQYLDDHFKNPEKQDKKYILMEDFKVLVHEYIDTGYTDLAKKYGPLVTSKEIINMVDPSGGPYLSEGMEVFGFGGEYLVDYFERTEKGYKIITKK
jgi:hypothetical protein